MNPKELANLIINNAKQNHIDMTECDVYNHDDHLSVSAKICNDFRNDWVYKHDVELVIREMMPVERPFKILQISLANRDFYPGDIVELNNIWIRLDYNEKDPKELDISAVCGTWRQGWMTGKVVETPKQNDRALVILFDRDVYIEKETKWWGHVDALEKAVADGDIEKVEKGQPVYCGTRSWIVRKV